MRRSLMMAGLLASGIAAGTAQAQRTVDRLGYSTAPRVDVWFSGGGMVGYGEGMQVQFQTDDDAYVVVGRVDSDGRLSILYPYSRSQRALVRGRMTTTVRDPRFRSEASFYVSDRLRGYVFAIASYTPVDLSTFDSRDFTRMGGYSAFTRVNRTVAREPDEYVSRVAAELFWGTDAEYDYDVAYYSPTIGAMSYVSSALSHCGSSAFRRLSNRYPWYTYDDYLMSPYDLICRDYFLGIQCISSFYSLFVPSFCGRYFNRETVVAGIPTVPAGGDSVMPNEGVIRSGLWRPDTVSGTPEQRRDEGRAERINADIDGRGVKGGSEFEGIYSIPARAKQKIASERVGGVDIIRAGKRSAEPSEGNLRDVRRADGSPSALNKGQKEPRFADGSPARFAPPQRTEPVSYEPIGASKAPKRYLTNSSGSSSFGGGTTSSGAQTRNTGGGSSSQGGAAAAPAGSGKSIGQASTSGKEKPPPQ